MQVFFYPLRPLMQWIVVGLLPLLFLSACSKPETVSETLTQGDHEARVVLPSKQAKEMDQVAWVLREKIKKVDKELNIHNPESELSRVNRIAPETRLPLSKSIQPIVRLALHYTERTGGLFDITLGPTAALWGLRGAPVPQTPPSQDIVDACLNSSGAKQIELSEYSIAFGTPYTRMDLSHLESGYILDLSIQELRRRQIKNVMLTRDNSYRVLGWKSSGTYWTVPLSFPQKQDALLGKIALHGGQALAIVDVSKDGVMIAGTSYAGRLDPRTGRPAQHLLSAIAMAPSATEAQVLASALFAGGLETAETLSRNFPRCEFALLPYDDPSKIWCTPGIVDSLELVQNGPQIQLIERAIP